MARPEYFQLGEEKEYKPIIKEPEASFEMAQTPANWVPAAVVLSGVLAAAAAVISFKVAEYFREKEAPKVVN